MFFPALLERCRRIDRALFAVIMQGYVHGVSTRADDNLVRAFGVGTGISTSEVSRNCADLDAERSRRSAPARWRTRSSGTCSPRHTLCKVRIGAHGISRAMIVATGACIYGAREVLGTAVGGSRSFEFWTDFLRSLKARGLSAVHVVISNAHADPVEVAAQWGQVADTFNGAFPEAHSMMRGAKTVVLACTAFPRGGVGKRPGPLSLSNA